MHWYIKSKHVNFIWVESVSNRSDNASNFTKKSLWWSASSWNSKYILLSCNKRGFLVWWAFHQRSGLASISGSSSTLYFFNLTCEFLAAPFNKLPSVCFLGGGSPLECSADEVDDEKDLQTFTQSDVIKHITSAVFLHRVFWLWVVDLEKLQSAGVQIPVYPDFS